MIRKRFIAEGTRPFRTKWDVQKLMKTRDMEDYLTNKVPMQSDKLKIRLINEGYLDPTCAICLRSFWVGETIPLQLDHINGISILFIILTTFITPLCIISVNSTIEYRLKDFLVAILLMETMMIIN